MARKKARVRSTARVRRPRWDYVERTRHLSVNLVFLAPWLLVYVLCWISAGDAVETAAAVSLRDALRLLGPRTALALTLITALGLCALVVVRVRQRGVDAAVFPGMLAEGIAFGFALLFLGDLLTRLLPVGRWVGLFPGPLSLDGVRRLGIAVGAGIFEELVFRGLLCLGLYRLLRGVIGADRWTSGAVAVLVSAVLFSAYHHWGAGAEPWSAPAFTFRFHAGVLLGVIFLTRGLGIAAFAHGFYDALVLFG
jgi:membrane protease YdiL (CAAX protease family)